MQLGHIHQILPLHNDGELRQLKRDWVSAFVAPQPIPRIRDYFGSQIALYFTWLGHYTQALAVPALLGASIYYMDVLTFDQDKRATERDQTVKGWVDTQLLSDITFVLFALFNCVWSTIWLESWKRRQAELAYTWGYDADYPDYMTKYLDEPRTAFKPDYFEVSQVTGRLEPYSLPWRTHVQRWLVSAPLTAVCIAFVVSMMFMMLRAQYYCDLYFGDIFLLRYLSLVPLILYALFILIGDAVYREFALWLNNMGAFFLAFYHNFNDLRLQRTTARTPSMRTRSSSKWSSTSAAVPMARSFILPSTCRTFSDCARFSHKA